ncbi:VOC family protein [Tamlana fucoidanivorans]|uniref:VOC family protein n=1 Tax=Allotamlana fucoidanivorans TaxID=2583814 RepID=A0A5C4SLJ7_9FLAO|nr:VOC family protein [Tamlana fucoidanivorans]TNJ44142.1 VOC family protein [Tamlana fucoidanivorans]
MKLGAFSVSLNVKDIKVSKIFYERLGFSLFAGDIDQHYVIMKNGNSIIGLFQGMFEQNILTFNPGWDENANALASYDDVRSIQDHLKKHNITLEREVDKNSSGPGSIVLYDPDGNTILIDQHV